MAILLEKNSTVIIQGITGKEGQKAAAAMSSYGTNVVGGVRPGKAGETVHGVPVFDTVQACVDSCGPIDVTTIYVPPFAAKSAMLEAIEAGVSQINCIVERVPIKDTAYCLAAAKEKDIHIIGPSSLGYIAPGIGRIGVVGGALDQVEEIYTPGCVGIISRSGGMTNEVAWQIRQAGLGQSTAVHVGGDLLMGTTYTDLLAQFEQDEQTDVIVLFGEHGGSYEFEVADMIEAGNLTKPLAMYVGGKFASRLPEGMTIGHAGAIVEKGKGADAKTKRLQEVGAHVVEHYQDLATIAKTLCKH